MRSLAWRLTAAFLVVSITASLLMAGLIAWQTRRQFDHFVIDRFRATLLPTLVTHYQLAGNWQGVEAAMLDEPGASPGRPTHHYAVFTLEDAAGTAFAARPHRVNCWSGARQPIVSRHRRRGSI
jgi:hypothetical protein